MSYAEVSKIRRPGVLHHVMGWGIERKNIFWNDKDRSDFIDRLAGVVERGRKSLVPRFLGKIIQPFNPTTTFY